MAKQGKKIKIALVGYKLATGGLERVFSTVSDLLVDANCEVDVIVLEDKVEYSHQGTLINLGNYSKFQKYFKLRQHLKTNQFDYIIDFRHRINPWMELLFIHYIYSGFKFIYTIHSSKLEVYFTSENYVAQQILKKVYKIVAVSNALNEKIKNEFYFEKGVVIPNTITSKIAQTEFIDPNLPFQYCLAVGRLVALKQFDKLIDTYCKSGLYKRQIHLVILGEGEEKKRLEMQIEKLQMTAFIHLLGFKKNVNCYILNSIFLVVTSKYEGFSMVILESLSLGIPVISFDCEVGPRELVQHKYNGLLIENQNFVALEQALVKMAFDYELYKSFKENAKASVNKFSNENTSKIWLDLLKNNTL